MVCEKIASGRVSKVGQDPCAPVDELSLRGAQRRNNLIYQSVGQVS